jgi:hypothetical protein
LAGGGYTHRGKVPPGQPELKTLTNCRGITRLTEISGQPFCAVAIFGRFLYAISISERTLVLYD